MANFQERLKQLRTEAGLTQNELAEKLRMSKGAIGNYESGQREPNMDTLDTIADFFIGSHFLNHIGSHIGSHKKSGPI